MYAIDMSSEGQTCVDEVHSAINANRCYLCSIVSRSCQTGAHQPEMETLSNCSPPPLGEGLRSYGLTFMLDNLPIFRVS